MLLVQDVPERPTPAQLRRLRARQPYSVPLLRRLEVAAGAYAGVGVGGDSDSDSDGDGGGGSSIGTTAHAHVLFVYEVDDAGAAAAAVDGLPLDTPFAAAYVDVSQTPETAAWLFCSDEAEGVFAYAADNDADPATWAVDRGAALVAGWAPARAARCRRLAVALLRQVRALARAAAPTVSPLLLARATTGATGAAAAYSGAGSIRNAAQAAATLTTHLKATVHEGVRYLLAHPPAATATAIATAAAAAANAPVQLASWDAYDKWLFRAADVPAVGAETAATLVVAEKGEASAASSSSSTATVLAWDRVRRGDVPLVVSRTAIPRTAATLLAVPSVALRAGPAGGPEAQTAAAPLVAWAFLGLDGSLWTLHCEPAFRGRGLATAVAARLLRQNGRLFRATDADDNGRNKPGQRDDNDDDDDNLWLLADVSATNRASQAVCRRLGGQRAWSTSWIVVVYDSLGDD